MGSFHAITNLTEKNRIAHDTFFENDEILNTTMCQDRTDP